MKGFYLLNKGIDPRKRSPFEQSRVVFWGYPFPDFLLVDLSGRNAEGHRENDGKKSSKDNKVGSNAQNIYIAGTLSIDVLAVNRCTNREESSGDVNEI